MGKFLLKRVANYFHIDSCKFKYNKYEFKKAKNVSILISYHASWTKQILNNNELSLLN